MLSLFDLSCAHSTSDANLLVSKEILKINSVPSVVGNLGNFHAYLVHEEQ